MMKSPNRLRILAVLAGLAATTLAVSCAFWPRTIGGGNAGTEAAAIAGLRAYLGAQGVFQSLDRYGKGKLVYANRIDGTGFPDLFRVGGPLPGYTPSDGTEIKLIDLALARASSPQTAKAGYWFVDIVGDALTGKHYDYTKECGLCAVPAEYGETGFHTFVINTEGTVYKKDNGGKPVTVFPDVDMDGWVDISM